MHKIGRNSNIDKIKGLLIFLVVFGHFLEKYMGWHGDLSSSLLKFIYAIHMPAFIFISGMFFNIEKWKESSYRYFSIFLAFQFLYIIFDYIVNGGDVSRWLSTPYWIMWFMFTLSIYCLITPILIRQKQVLFISVCLAIYIGLVETDNYPYSIGRTLSFLPFFILGVLYGKKIYSALFEKWYAVIISIAVLIALGIASYFIDMQPSWLFGVANINDYYDSVVFGIFIKISLLATSILSILSVMRLSKVLPSFFEIFGKRSLSIYLFHGFVVILSSKYVYFSQPDCLMLIVCFVLSLATCIILKEQFFGRVIARLSKPIMKIFK
ncbi:Arginine/ornithine antiporter ArcD [Psychrobacter nivimaris]|uniref:Arginine/ornithine antiporter ArcD n=2 Tax=Psychrobacter nivimaris TaxID=281738 RepID=A0A6N7C0X0_9GAMM|nr:Arginine/ornithine antiporter ArcD [Psychrobacter nivimaris]